MSVKRRDFYKMDQQSQATTIEDIPDEALERIFSYLSPKLRKEATWFADGNSKVIKLGKNYTILIYRWDEAISMSQRLMKIYRVSLPQREDDVAVFLESRRKITDVTIIAINNNVLQFLKSLLKSNNIKHLEIAEANAKFPWL